MKYSTKTVRAFIAEFGFSASESSSIAKDAKKLIDNLKKLSKELNLSMITLWKEQIVFQPSVVLDDAFNVLNTVSGITNETEKETFWAKIKLLLGEESKLLELYEAGLFTVESEYYDECNVCFLNEISLGEKTIVAINAYKLLENEKIDSDEDDDEEILWWENSKEIRF